jgi:hypothetical protein
MTRRNAWFAIIAGVLIIVVAAGGSIWWTALSSCWHPGVARNIGIAEICP